MNQATQTTDDHIPFLRAIVSQIHRKMPRLASYDDLLSYGTIGLLEAQESYDETKGAFTTFAYWRIRGAVYDGLRQFQWGSRTFPVKAEPIGDIAGESVLRDCLADLKLAKLIQNLPVRERSIMLLHYYHNQTFVEIGEAMGVSKSWCKRLHDKVLRRLRGSLTC